MPTIVALNNKVIVQPDPLPEKKSSIYMPDEAKDALTSRTGTVIAAGRGTVAGNLILAPQVRAGDRVYFNKYSGLELEHEGVTYLVLDEEQVLAIDHSKRQLTELQEKVALAS